MQARKRSERGGRRGWWAWLARWLQGRRRQRAQAGLPGMPVPDAPRSLSLQADEMGIELAWQDRSDNEDGFRVYRRAWDEPHAPVYETAANVEAWVDNGVEPGVAYSYYVVAFNDAGESEPSNEEYGMLEGE